MFLAIARSALALSTFVSTLAFSVLALETVVSALITSVFDASTSSGVTLLYSLTLDSTIDFSRCIASNCLTVLSFAFSVVSFCFCKSVTLSCADVTSSAVTFLTGLSISTPGLGDSGFTSSA